MKVSAVTDEISSDFETAVELGVSWGIQDFEIRGLGAHRIGKDWGYLEDRAINVIKDFEVNVVALSPGVFKIPLAEKKISDELTILEWQGYQKFREREQSYRDIEQHLDVVLPNTFRIAKQLQTKIVIVFGIVKPTGARGKCPQAVIDFLQEAAKRAEKQGITLALENEHICWADTGKNTAAIVERVGSKALRVNWDPANAFLADETPFPDGYEYVKDYITHVHFKDAAIDPATGRKKFVTNGAIDWESQLRELQNAGYNGHISIETHCRPKIRCARETLERIKSILGMRQVFKEKQ